ncbi:type IV secretion system protein VirB10 [Novosphingobium sp. KN65.2]|uniref:type IV secretion system protein VirB10 n=1 Tax=Novosphingobium sp. KN65.2 TaxID=1478134 RepID=UPI0005E7ECC5|nr:type IV secretion system protein VirB10 [Novosphingobium sp. KN65.2]CDO37980.1 Conjugation TrbI family protein [Novosphingobium sp. KN65.2]
MAETVMDRGGEGASVDTFPQDTATSSDARSGGWGNIALFGAGIALVATVSGIAIGYGAFHRSASSQTAEAPAQASQKSVDDVVASPARQRAALASELGKPGALATDVFGRPIVGDGDGTNGPAAIANGPSDSAPETLAQKRYEERVKLADAARRSPIMAYQANGLPSSLPIAAQAASSHTATPDGPSVNGGLNFGASGFGPPSDDAAPILSKDKGSTDFSEALGHSTIETVHASLIQNRNFLLSAGTLIPCSLQTAINSTQAGFVSCVINHDVFSENGRVILLDKGTKVLGQYSGGISQGQARLFVLWTRALTPRGVAIDLGSPAADNLGRSSLAGGVDTQFWARFGAALMMSVLEDASNIAGRAVAAQGSYTSQVPGTMGQTILEDSKNIKPILRKNQGDTAAIFVARDFDFSAVYDLQLRR